MSKLYYCLGCKKILKDNEKCEQCGDIARKPLKKGTSVNIIGTKQKGKIKKIMGDKVELILRNELSGKYLKEYEYSKLKKIL